MKHITFLFILNFILNSAFAQDKTHRVNNYDCSVYTNPSRLSSKIATIEPNRWVKVIKTQNDFYKIKYNDKEGYILKTDIQYSFHDYEMDSIRNEIELSRLKKEVDERKKILDSLDYYMEMFNKSLCNQCVYVVPSSDGNGGIIDFTFNVNSRFKKVIKYITFYVQPYNGVDDKIGKLLKFKGVGPISDDKISTYQFERALYSNQFSYMKVQKVLIQFMDLSQLTILSKDLNYSKNSIMYIEKLKAFSSK